MHKGFTIGQMLEGKKIKKVKRRNKKKKEVKSFCCPAK